MGGLSQSIHQKCVVQVVCATPQFERTSLNEPDGAGGRAEDQRNFTGSIVVHGMMAATCVPVWE
jgi:hypothetical protein